MSTEREKTLFQTSGLIAGANIVFGNYFNPTTDDPLRQEPNDGNGNYRYGTSYPEQVAMSKLIPIIASAFHADQPQLQSELQDYVLDIQGSNYSNPDDVFYPGKILKARTEQLQSQIPWTFRPLDRDWET